MPTQSDPLLRLFLTAKTERAASGCLDILVQTHALPIIMKVIAHRLQPGTPGNSSFRPDSSESEEVRGNALAKLIGHLWELRTGENSPIEDFRAYVAVIARNACADLLRRKYPGRWKLQNHLRYIVLHDRRLSLRTANGQEILGLAAWNDRPLTHNVSSSFQEFQANPNSFAQRLYSHQSLPKIPDTELLPRLVVEIGDPIPFNKMIELIASIRGIRDEHPKTETSEANEDADFLETLPSSAKSIHDQVQAMTFLRSLWQQILELSVDQRCAILLNIRDAAGRGIIALLSIVGVATPRQIAHNLEIPDNAFAELWHDLPLEDAKIAEFLSRTRKREITRQQVINLRKSAREKLTRRMRAEFD